MATEKNLQTIDLKIGSQEQLNENINTYDEGTLFGTTDLIDVGDLTPDLRNKVESNAKTNASNTFAESQIFNKDITVNGNIIQNGDTYKTHAEELYTKKDIIFTRDGAVSSLGDAEYTGLQAVKYDGTNDGQLVFDKDGVARVGDVGDTQPLATRSEKEDLVGGNLLQWDAANNRIIDAGKSSSEFLILKTPSAVQTDFVQIVKDSNGVVRQQSAVGVATVSSTNKAAYAPVLRGAQGQLTCHTASEANQTDYDCVNRGEFKEKAVDLTSAQIITGPKMFNIPISSVDPGITVKLNEDNPDPGIRIMSSVYDDKVEINALGMRVFGEGSETYTEYNDTSIIKLEAGTIKGIYSFPDKSGTIALVDDISYYNHSIMSAIKIDNISYSLVVNFISTRSDAYTTLESLPVTRMENIRAVLIVNDVDGNSYKSQVTASYYTDKIYVSGVYIKSDATIAALQNTQVSIDIAIENDTVVKII